MKIAYFDCICGAAGDMIIGSLLDCGLDLDDLSSELTKLNLKGYELTCNMTSRHHITATKFTVRINETHSHRGLKDIEKIIADSSLDEAIKTAAAGIFQRLARAEAKVHGETIENVHFHEVGMIDAIIDVCGSLIGLKLLGIDKVYCSPLTIGSGTVDTRHGTMPVPAPATGELILGFPVKHTIVNGEILTPTGSAILTTIAEFEKPGEFTPVKSGYGAGDKDFKELPNLLRLFIGDSKAKLASDQVALLETNLDRTSPEQIALLAKTLIANRALDVFITPIQMKKNRPGQMLSVICKVEDESNLAAIIFSSGVTLGLRRQRIDRWKLEREEILVETQYGKIPVKLARYEDKILYFPEFESLAEAAARAQKNIDDIQFEILSRLRKEK